MDECICKDKSKVSELRHENRKLKEENRHLQQELKQQATAHTLELEDLGQKIANLKSQLGNKAGYEVNRMFISNSVLSI